MVSNEDREFHINLAKIQIEAGEISAFGVSLLGAAAGIAGVIISFGAEEILNKIVQYLGLVELMLALFALGFVVLILGKKISNHRLDSLNEELQSDKARGKKNEKKKTIKDKQNSSRPSRWRCRGYM